MNTLHGVGDHWKKCSKLMLSVEISKFEIEFYCIFYLSLVFFLKTGFLQLHTRLFFKG